MSLNRWNARRDASDAPIVQGLKQAGAKVLRGRENDLWVLYRRNIFMLECKTDLKSRKTQTQLQLVKDGWPVIYVTDPLQALTAIGAVP